MTILQKNVASFGYADDSNFVSNKLKSIEKINMELLHQKLKRKKNVQEHKSQYNCETQKYNNQRSKDFGFTVTKKLNWTENSKTK